MKKANTHSLHPHLSGKASAPRTGRSSSQTGGARSRLVRVSKLAWAGILASSLANVPAVLLRVMELSMQALRRGQVMTLR